MPGIDPFASITAAILDLLARDGDLFLQLGGNLFRGLAIILIAGPPLALIPYLLLRKSPLRWWLGAGLAALPILIIVYIVVPVWILPLYNRYAPLSDKALETRILAQAARAGSQRSV